MNITWEEVSMQIILHGGNARASAYEAIAFARKGDVPLAEKTLQDAEKELQAAHLIQTKALQIWNAEENINIPLIMIHAQDHLMTAMAEKNLITELIYLYKKLYEQEEMVSKCCAGKEGTQV